jgi:hypothetical protein
MSHPEYFRKNDRARVLEGTASARAMAALFDSDAGSRPWSMAPGSLEGLKWAGLGLMLLDHINKYFYGERLSVVFDCGRIVMPIFGFVLAYNLARPSALASGVHRRMMVRLAIAGLAAVPACTMLNAFYVSAYAWWPLNILFTLMLVVAITALIDRKGTRSYFAAAGIFLVGGALVEYLWIGLLVCLAAWHFCRRASIPRLGLWCLSIVLLTWVNGNTWAILAVPIVLAGQRRLPLARHTWVFYAFYPVHLSLLLIVRRVWF